MNQDSKNSNVVEGQGIIMRALLQVVALLKSRKFWVELVIMTVGMFVAALGVYFFLIQVNSSLAQLLDFHWYLLNFYLLFLWVL